MQKKFLMRVIRWFFVILCLIVCSVALARGGSALVTANPFSPLFPPLLCVCLLASCGILCGIRSGDRLTDWLLPVLAIVLSGAISMLSQILAILLVVSIIGGGIIHQLCRIARTLAEINRTLNKQATSKISPRD